MRYNASSQYSRVLQSQHFQYYFKVSSDTQGKLSCESPENQKENHVLLAYPKREEWETTSGRSDKIMEVCVYCLVHVAVLSRIQCAWVAHPHVPTL